MQGLMLKIPPQLQDHITAPENKTRQRIILIAKRRFLLSGFAKSTIGDLCHELRMSKKTFYKHFRDKEDLVYAIVAETVRTVFPKFLELHQSSDPPPEKMTRFMSMISDYVMPNITVHFLADVQAIIPELWEFIAAMRAMNMKNVVSIIEAGQKDGYYRRDVDPQTFWKVINLILDRVADPRLLYENELQIQDVAGILLKIVESGLRALPEGGLEK